MIADQKHPRRVGLWLGAAAAFLVLFGLALWMSLPRQGKRFDQDPRFVVTTVPRWGVPANATPIQRFWIWCYGLEQRFSRPHPLTFSFPASPKGRCSIHGLLNQCMEVTGVRYVIAREVAAGSVEFGATNTLNGAQWAKAFTTALETGQPEWWDSAARKFRHENLVLLTNDAKTVLVLPSEMAQEFRRKDPR